MVIVTQIGGHQYGFGTERFMIFSALFTSCLMLRLAHSSNNVKKL